jgi:lysophospholipase L1-like esterase
MNPFPKLTVCTLIVLSTIAFTPADEVSKWEKDIRAFEELDAKQLPPRDALLFIGSSSIRLWKSLDQDFPEKKVINRGFGGSEIADSIQFANRIIIPYRPKAIILYAGNNDLNSGKTPATVFADFKRFTETIHASLPECHIGFISIAPSPARWRIAGQMRAANRMIREFCSKDARLRFIDVFDAMLGADGMPRPELYVTDRLHLNEDGYAIWKKIVGPQLP